MTFKLDNTNTQHKDHRLWNYSHTSAYKNVFPTIGMFYVVRMKQWIIINNTNYSVAIFSSKFFHFSYHFKSTIPNISYHECGHLNKYMDLIQILLFIVNKNALSSYYLLDRVHSLEGNEIARHMSIEYNWKNQVFVAGKNPCLGIVWVESKKMNKRK